MTTKQYKVVTKPSRLLLQLIAVAVIFAFALVCYRFYGSWKEVAISDGWLTTLLMTSVGGSLLLSLFDFFNWRFLSEISAKRKLPNNISAGAHADIQVSVTNHSRFYVVGELFDHFPELLEATIKPHQFHLQPEQETLFTYRVKAHTRGDAFFGDIQLVINSPLKLWQWHLHIPNQDMIKVYPNFTQISHFNMLAGEENLSEMGIHLRQLRGQGMEFQQLRDYRKGDSMRQIDWGATSRRQKLISREYQEERDQQILFLVDCGKRMRTKDGQLSHFDHTLNALLLLAYVALKQDDAVGFQAFGGHQRGMFPIKGQKHINSLLNQLYDVHPTLSASDYLLAAQNLIAKTKKRALVVLVSNMRDDDLPELVPAIKLLQKHHLVLLANLRDASLDNMLEKPIECFSDAVEYAETSLFFEKRDNLLNYFQSKGVVTIDSTPQQLPAHLVNQYYTIKRSGRL